MLVFVNRCITESVQSEKRGNTSSLTRWTVFREHFSWIHFTEASLNEIRKNAAQSCRSLATADPHLLVIIFMFMCQDAASSVQVWCSTVALVVKLHQGCSNIKQFSSPIIMEEENQELSWVRWTWPYVLGACTAFGLTTLKQNRYVITDMYYKAS